MSIHPSWDIRDKVKMALVSCGLTVIRKSAGCVMVYPNDLSEKGISLVHWLKLHGIEAQHQTAGWSAKGPSIVRCMIEDEVLIEIENNQIIRMA